MRKRTCTILTWLLLVATLASCGPTAAVNGTPDTAKVPPTPGTPEPSRAPAACQGRIAFIGQTDGDRDLFVINADGSGLTNVTNEEGYETSPSWSPDGTRIVFARHVGNSDIYVIRPDGSESVRLTDQPSREYAPSWSPDSRHVLYGSTSGYASEIFVVSAEGGLAVPLTDSVAHKPDFSWSPQGAPGGERVAFTMLDSYNQGDVYVMAAPDGAGAGGSDLSNLTQHPAHDCCVDWAPDGARILFLSSRTGASAAPLVGVRWDDFPSAASLIPVRLGDSSAASSGIVVPLTTVMPEQPRGVYIVSSEGSGLTRLTDGTGNAKHASWSPAAVQGSERIAFVSDRDGNDKVYVLTLPAGSAASGGELTRLTFSPEDEGHPTWSPDGSCLAFESYRGSALGLYVIRADGSGLNLLADSVAYDTGPSWSP